MHKIHFRLTKKQIYALLLRMFAKQIEMYNIKLRFSNDRSYIYFPECNGPKIIYILNIPIFNLNDYITILRHEIGHIWLSKENPDIKCAKELNILEDIVINKTIGRKLLESFNIKRAVYFKYPEERIILSRLVLWAHYEYHEKVYLVNKGINFNIFNKKYSPSEIINIIDNIVRLREVNVRLTCNEFTRIYKEEFIKYCSVLNGRKIFGILLGS